MNDTLMRDRAVGLCDCNNFFVSCERRADPRLEHKPVVVLSGNDGCIIARSNEVKKMGIPMGIPYFKVAACLKYRQVTALSGNHLLYSAVSEEVLRRLKRYSDVVENYSIDESFLNLNIPCIKDPVGYCGEIRQDIWKNCQIPVSIGISATKTLAKLGSKCAKKVANGSGVFMMDSQKYLSRNFMLQFEVSDVWGIGQRMTDRLLKMGVKSAADFSALDDLLLKERFNINALHTAWELRGIAVYPVTVKDAPPKSIQVSRSFGDTVENYDDLWDAVRYFTCAAARQLRGACQQAHKLAVYITTSRFHPESYYCREKESVFSNAVCLDEDFLLTAHKILNDIYIEGPQYKKAGVKLSDFVDCSFGRQEVLFTPERMEDNKEDRRRRVARLTDRLNMEFGCVKIAPAACYGVRGEDCGWLPKQEHCSEKLRLRPALPLVSNKRFGF